MKIIKSHLNQQPTMCRSISRRSISRREFERFKGTKYQKLYIDDNDNFPMAAKDINTNEEFDISDALVFFPPTIDTTPEGAAFLRSVEHLADTRNNNDTTPENAALIRSVEHLADTSNNIHISPETGALIVVSIMALIAASIAALIVALTGA
jgi:hypothetical protein